MPINCGVLQRPGGLDGEAGNSMLLHRKVLKLLDLHEIDLLPAQIDADLAVRHVISSAAANIAPKRFQANVLELCLLVSQNNVRFQGLDRVSVRLSFGNGDTSVPMRIILRSRSMQTNVQYPRNLVVGANGLLQI